MKKAKLFIVANLALLMLMFAPATFAFDTPVGGFIAVDHGQAVTAERPINEGISNGVIHARRMPANSESAKVTDNVTPGFIMISGRAYTVMKASSPAGVAQYQTIGNQHGVTF
jgi:hypothetical protein